ncbi:MAG TPA: hypothetical protein VNL70_08785 [Tepidisphaeraceae bacterium]|nr:hypothetical protein [Tepidisphaeraceae bacterium]
MKSMRQGLAVAVAMLLLSSGLLSAQVLEQVPKDALVVLKIRDLKATSDKVARLAQDLGLAAMSPEMADPLAAIQAKLNIQNGLNTNGEAAFVFIDPEKVGGQPDQAMLLLIPVSDYKAFLGNWPDAQVQDNVAQVRMGEAHEPGYVANWGAFAALSPSRDLIANKPATGITLPAVTSKHMQNSDAVLLAHTPAIRAKLLPMLQQGREEILAKIEAGLRSEPQAAKFAPTVRAVVNQALNMAEGFVRDAESAAVGINLAPEGINCTVMSEFTPTSYVGSTIAGMKNTDAPLLTGLPDGKYLVFGGSISDPKIAAKLLDDLIQPIIKELVAVGEAEGKAVQDYIDAMKAYVAAQTGQVFGMLAPSGAIGAEPLIQFISVQSGQPQAMSAAYQKMATAQADAMKVFNIPGAAAAVPSLSPNAKTVAGVRFDQIITKIDMNAQDPMAMRQAQMMNMMYGPQGAVVNIGTVADKLLVVSGTSDQFISSAIEAVKANATPLAQQPRVQKVASQLPRQRMAVVYLPVDDIVSTALNYAQQFGFNMPVQLPPDLPPVGATVSSEQSAIRVDTHIPTDLVQSLVAAGMQAMMQMQGGGPRGGGL